MSTHLDSAISHPKPELDLSLPEDVLSYLAKTPFASTSADPLSGGTGNFIFRLHLAKPLHSKGGEESTEVKTLILKHAKGYVASNKSFEIDVGRQAVEAMALKHVRALLPPESLVTVPEVYFHDPEAHVLIMEDAGSGARNLKDLLRTTPLSELASRNLGTALGEFLAAVHVRGTADTELMGAVQKNEDSRRVTAWVTYGRLVDMLKLLGENTGLVEPPLASTDLPPAETITEITAFANERVKQIQEAHSTFTMGDFWTGNVVVRLGESGDIERAFVIDWELAKPGLQFLDFAQFTAEMHTLRCFHPAAAGSVDAALNAYEEAYRQRVEVDEQFVRSAASHVGAHMITITPSIATWGSKEKTREVVKEGIEYLLGGLQRDTEWLRDSAVGGLLSGASA